MELGGRKRKEDRQIKGETVKRERVKCTGWRRKWKEENTQLDKRRQVIRMTLNLQDNFT